ncbi:MAG: AmmeMemoRadiSam system radical SAM enzyme [Thalassospira sp.]|uniref:AmmeMemoRadiSam system radical SAM enzyme n=1 Tax=Thalassospira sp. TaxID=1912094 RepID=UPI003A87C8B7
MNQTTPQVDTVPGRYWHHLDDGRIQCDVCPRFCKLNDGQRGLCFVRAREGDQMVLTTWGRSSGFCIDPIEKKPLNHFLPGTPILSFGTAGCNLTCKFCQNYEISKARQMDKLSSLATPEMIAKTAKAHGCSSVAFTYNDPVIFLEYAVDVAQACREMGLRTVAVTAGYIGEKAREEFFRHMDAANVDLKGFTDRFYHQLCSAHLDDVLETLKYLKHETGVWFELTNLVIPGENDGDAEFDEMTGWVQSELGADVPMHFTAFHPDWKMMDTPRTPPETLLRARDIAIKNGIRYPYVGNVHDKSGSSTYCHGCGDILIGRDWYQLSDWNLDAHGACRKCGTHCGGVFQAKPGTWGPKRQPVRLKAGTK